MIHLTIKQNRFLFLAVLVAMVIIAAVMQSQFLLNWDVSWCTHVSARLIKGGTYIKDFFDVNLPLTLLLYAPPILLSKFFDVSIVITTRLYIFLLSFFSIGFSFYFLRKLFIDRMVSYIFALAIAFVLLILPIYHFGQREHLFLIFTLPYFIALSLRFRGNKINPSMAIALGCYAAIGFVIKPYFFMTFLLLEFGLVLYSKSILSWFRLESMTIVLLTLIYLVGIFIFYPSFISGIVPLTKYFYQTIATEAWLNIITGPAIFYAFLTYLFFKTNGVRSDCKELSIILFMAMVGALFSYLIQRTAWTYHVLPLISLTILLLVSVLLSFFQKIKRRSEIIFVAIVTLFFLYYPIRFMTTEFLLGVNFRDKMTSLIQYMQKK